jgi:hypothetical protein
MLWKKMRIPGVQHEESLPGDRGRYLLWLEPPNVVGEGHYVHFSWKDGSFCIRDYINQSERRQSPGVTATDIWKAASDRIPAKGELYVPVENFDFWTAKIIEQTENHRQGRTSASLWARLSSKFTPKSQDAELHIDVAETKVDDQRDENDRDVYRSFMPFWRRGVGFDVIERTVGCSARYKGEPLLWVYPTYFQIAPQGKGNAHNREIRALRDRHFPELRSKGTIGFNSEHFTWNRFQSFITDVRNMTNGT